MGFAKLGVMDLSELYRKKELSPVEYAKDMAQRIESENYNAIVTFDKNLCMKYAKESEKRYLEGEPLSMMDGVPIGIKDIIDTKEIRTTYGCNAYKEHYPKEDAFAVKQLLKAGANVSVKTNTCQFAMGPTGEVSFAGPVKNPSNPKHVTGGSSSGSASAVRANLVPCALGTDSGGSIRLPSALTGVIGLKPTFGLVSNQGVMPVCESVDVVGPMTRNVVDNALVLSTIAGYNELDWRSAPYPKQDYTQKIGDDAVGRIAIGVDFLKEPIDPFVKQGFEMAVRLLRKVGYETEEKSLGDLSELRQCHQILMMASAHYVHKKEIEQYRSDVYDQVYRRLCSGDVTSDRHIYNELNKHEMIRRMNEAMQGFDFFIHPTTPLLACKIGEGEKEIKIGAYMVNPFLTYGQNTWIASYCNWPSINIPTGENEDGLTAGLCIIARPYKEKELYQIGDLLLKLVKNN
ncbi:amidase [Eubacterium oxidoreducens]|uniref:Aspartyl-tRNA(Asn)/glutamyl-tRNA(Gln) amidotransferase subunit A n=1 Tax=Eubacterium oxidoreducens TaxID=1732 RepID=A0A1G6C778_EUBOX|nr:amidase [Eubacterium oxidoreducens]SDB28717.1 aspartyl-tRNA(Asn)/glutamyl-tRNA(Gln) amidotransferase subunit A [Eubacterium oxidoreducens]